VAIVGGGITGLAAAFALQEQGATGGPTPACTLIEASPAWGGKIATHRVGDCVIEAGPDSFLSQKPWALDLCARLGIADRLINTNEVQKKTVIYSRGRLRELPEGLVVIVPRKLGPFLRSGLLSWRGMARMGLDLVLPPRREDGDESLAGFFTRRLGREAFERFIEPLMAGIYAGDAEQISLRATFPRFLDLERKHGSLIRGMLASRAQTGAPARTMFVTLRDGLGDLAGTLVERIRQGGAVLRAGQPVTALRVRSSAPGRGTYELLLADGAVVAADAVVLTTPAFASAILVRPLSPGTADLLESIPYASTVTISFIYETDRVGSVLSGFGFVVPRTEGSALLAATYTSLKWPHRTPPHQIAVRCYLGGAGREGVLALSDEELSRRAREELRKITGLEAEPTYAEINRWERAMPQYTLGHLDRIEAIGRSLGNHRGLLLAGAAYRGIGIPDCIREGSDAATGVMRYLTDLQP
jgi:oxygen-dependent protoporphyrinogen oxidase